MAKHEHVSCQHSKGLQYCEKCDVAYCNDCSKEWKICKESHGWWGANTSPLVHYNDSITMSNGTAGDYTGRDILTIHSHI